MCNRKTAIDMPQKMQDIIDEILKCSVDNKKVFGDYIAATIFKRNKNALYLNSTERCAYCLCSVNNEAERNESVLFVFELLSVLHELEEQHLIFVIPPTSNQGMHLFYEGRQFIRSGQDPEKDIIDEENTVIIKSDSNISIVSNAGQELLTGVKLPDFCIDQIGYYFSNIILPGNRLNSYKNRGYLTEEQYNTKRALFRSRVANWIAITIGCFTILFGLVNSCDSKTKNLKEESIKDGIVCDSIQQTDTSTTSNINCVAKGVKETDQMKDSSQVNQTSKSTNEIVNDKLK